MKFNSLYIMECNGWEWHHYNNDWLIEMDDSEDYDQYTLNILGREYSSVVRAVVSSHWKHMGLNGELGVIWLDVAKYENRPPYESHALEDMLIAIEYAEDNLLKIGMPFCSDYQFHGRNKANKKRRNDALRRKYKLKELQEKYEKEHENDY